MTLRHIRVFLAVYRTLSMTRAAEELHMVQPAVTRSIQELEHYYGVRLFERLGRRLYATDCARELYGYAAHIDDTFGEMEKRLLNRDTAGVLRVGATRTIGNCDLARIVSRFQAENAGMRVRVRVENGAGLERALLGDELDMALMEGVQTAPELIAQPFGGDQLQLIVPPDCALGARASLDEVLEYPLLMREEGSAVRAVIERMLEAHGRAVEPVWESASTQALVTAVEVGLGVAMLPDRLVREAAGQGRVRVCAIEGVELGRTYSIVYHRHKYITPAARRFMELCRAHEDD